MRSKCQGYAKLKTIMRNSAYLRWDPCIYWVSTAQNPKSIMRSFSLTPIKTTTQGQIIMRSLIVNGFLH